MAVSPARALTVVGALLASTVAMPAVAQDGTPRFTDVSDVSTSSTTMEHVTHVPTP